MQLYKDNKDIFSAISKAQNSLGNPDQLWFRGMSSRKFELLPSLLRYSNGFDQEAFLFHKYNQSARYIKEKKETDWETLFDMQHYGIPTRLLDWTEVLGIAIYFAIVDFKPTNSDSPVLFLLNPLKLNSYSRIESIYRVPAQEDFEYQKVYWKNKPFAPQYPIAIEPIFDNERIYAQQGKFTVHHNKVEALENICKEAIAGVDISPQNIKQLKDFLKFANLNESTVFPDILGAAQFIKKIANLVPITK